MTFNRWLGLASIIGGIVIAVTAYNLGVAQGAAYAAGAAAAGAAPYAYPYYWHRPWGFGFGLPLFLLFFWFFVARGFFWGPWHWRRGYHYSGDVPASFEDWHRRSHERMNADNPDRR